MTQPVRYVGMITTAGATFHALDPGLRDRVRWVAYLPAASPGEPFAHRQRRS